MIPSSVVSPEFVQEFIRLDMPALLTATFSAVSCALLGNFLVLRKQALMGDAIAHAVLPGIVIAFLVSGSRATWPVFLGAAIAGVVTAILIELVRKLGRLESGVSMGVVFTVLFAAGVILIEQAAARNVDLDADCLLHGQLERVFWLPPGSLEVSNLSHILSSLPRELLTSLSVLVFVCIFISAFYKELKLSSFDSSLADALGFRSTTIHFVLMTVVACAVVASFEAVGSILVIAMLICPAACARLLTDRLTIQIMLSSAIAIFSSLAGYILAAFGPGMLGYHFSLNAAGMITVVMGLVLMTSVLFAPTYGIFGRLVRRFLRQITTCREDLLGFLFRFEERSAPDQTRLQLRSFFHGRYSKLVCSLAFSQALRNAEIAYNNDFPLLTTLGRKKAAQLVRHHRLWESFFVDKVGLRPDHVHEPAEMLEHITKDAIADNLEQERQNVSKDPHDKPIPKP